MTIVLYFFTQTPIVSMSALQLGVHWQGAGAPIVCCSSSLRNLDDRLPGAELKVHAEALCLFYAAMLYAVIKLMSCR